MNAIAILTTTKPRNWIRGYTPEESRALENHYIACACAAGLVGGGKVPDQAKQKAALKAARSKASAELQNRIAELMGDMASGGTTINEMIEATAATRNRVLHAMRRLVQDGRAVCVKGSSQKPDFYYPATTMQREAGE